MMKHQTLRLPVGTYLLIHLVTGCCLFSQYSSSSTKNIFDELPALSTPPKTNCDELDHYLSIDPEHVTDAVAWWYKKQFVYPCIHHMALDYLTIPGGVFFC